MSFDTDRIPNPIDDEAVAEALSKAETARRAAKVSSSIKTLEATRGRRYSPCRLANFECGDSESKLAAVAKLREYLENVASHFGAGYGVTLFGPCGTGKDHLAFAVARGAVATLGCSAVHFDGVQLFERLRESFGGDGGGKETSVIGTCRAAGLLTLSDPVPVKGELTDYQASALYRVIDARYAAMRPTILTVNVKPGEAEARLGEAIVDRLRHASLVIHCNWESYRKANR